MDNKKNIRTVFGAAVLCILLYWGLQNMDRLGRIMGGLGTMILPFALGGAMAFIFNVPMRAIEAHLPRQVKGIKRPISLVITLAAVVSVLMIVSLLVVPQLQETTLRIFAQLPHFWKEAQQFMVRMMTDYPALKEWLQDPASIDWNGLVKAAVDWLQTSGLVLVGNTVSAATGLISGFVTFLLALSLQCTCCLRRRAWPARFGCCSTAGCRNRQLTAFWKLHSSATAFFPGFCPVSVWRPAFWACCFLWA